MSEGIIFRGENGRHSVWAAVNGGVQYEAVNANTPVSCFYGHEKPIVMTAAELARRMNRDDATDNVTTALADCVRSTIRAKDEE